uniref:Myb/SANT-like DNA-binding domain-containing protein n=1 Tax=Rhizophora mucronata TaxID=61149 RepID=A0A2P2IPD2_RHIMU
MEANISQGGILPGGPPFGGVDLHGSMRVHHQPQHPQAMNQHQHTLHRQGSGVSPCIHESFPLTMGTMHNSDQSISLNDEDEPSYTEEGIDGQNDVSKGKKGLPWQRVKWTDKMVRLLITAVSYIGEDVTSDCGGGVRRKFSVLQKKGKWKSVSKVMAERGFHVSPQQCEDKFNDLNKRYKRLNDMLGRGVSCQVVEKPALLDVLDYVTEKEKDDVRKILSSKHLFYEEMCSYHNGNRLHLPHDPALQRSVRLALRSRDDHENDDLRRHQDDLDEDDQEVDTDDHDDYEENHTSNGGGKVVHGLFGGPSKRLRPSLGHGDFCYRSSSQDGNKGCHPHAEFPQVDMNQVSPEGTQAAWLQKQWTESRKLQLEEQKLQIEVEMLELEKQRFKWQRFTKKKDRELEKLRMENERMKLENERMALELKCKEMGANFA